MRQLLDNFPFSFSIDTPYTRIAFRVRSETRNHREPAKARMVVSIMLVLEPAMGFTGVADYMDPDKIAANAGSTAWLLVDLLYLTTFVAIFGIVRDSKDRALLWSGLAGGLMFFLVGTLDRVSVGLPGLVTEPDTRRMALTAILPVRLAVLKVAAMGMALFAWRTTRAVVARSLADRAWRGLGYLALAAGVLFIFTFFPAPVVFFLWAAVLTWRNARSLRRPNASPAGLAGVTG